MPALHSAPRRVAYEKVVAGDPATLALLKDRVVLVGLLMPGKDVFSLPWPAGERWGVELIAAQVDAMARDVAIRPIDPIAELLLTSVMGLLGAVTVYRLREHSRARAHRRARGDCARVHRRGDRLVPIRTAAHRRTVRVDRAGRGRLAGEPGDDKEVDDMNAFLESAAVRRMTVWTVTVAMLLPTLIGCATPPGAAGPGEARLDGIVVDGNRLAQPTSRGWPPSPAATACGRRPTPA